MLDGLVFLQPKLIHDLGNIIGTEETEQIILK